MTAPRGYYLLPDVVGAREMREDAEKWAAQGETSVLHRHRHGMSCTSDCETIAPPKPPAVLAAPASVDHGHSIVHTDGRGWGDDDLPPIMVPG